MDPPMLHYHIRWSSKDVLDWESFASPAEAETSAKQLARPTETYSIVERDESCPRCWSAYYLKTADSDPNRKYPWQRAVLDAFKETRPESLIRKINEAQRAISARLTDPTPTDLDEQAAIRAALRSLRVLAPEQTKPQEPSEKKEIA